MPDYDDRGELAPRDVVSRAIVTPDGKDAASERLSRPDAPRPASASASRFPGIAAICAEVRHRHHQGPDSRASRRHYMIGGVTVDLEGRTTLPGLWAAGEVTSSGLARRESAGVEQPARRPRLRRPRRRGRVAASHGHADDDFQCPAAGEPARAAERREPLDLADIRNSLKSLMWRDVGVRRDAEGLDEAAENIDRWCGYVLARSSAIPSGWELQNMLTVARLMIEAALQRKETRGGHVRMDFPDTDEALCRHLTFRRKCEPSHRFPLPHQSKWPARTTGSPLLPAAVSGPEARIRPPFGHYLPHNAGAWSCLPIPSVLFDDVNPSIPPHELSPRPNGPNLPFLQPCAIRVRVSTRCPKPAISRFVRHFASLPAR